MPVTTIDVSALHASLDRKRRSEGKAWREVAKTLEISPSTFTRLAQGHRPDVDTFVTLLRWLDAPAQEFAQPEAPVEGRVDEEPMVAIASFLRSSRKVTKGEAAALQNIIEAAYQSIVKDQ